jgi:hypothetical protein
VKASIRDPNPIVFLENELMYGTSFPISDECAKDDFVLPLDKAKVMRQGADVTIVSFSRMVGLCLQAADELAKEGIHAEVRPYFTQPFHLSLTLSLPSCLPQYPPVVIIIMIIFIIIICDMSSCNACLSCQSASQPTLCRKRPSFQRLRHDCFVHELRSFRSKRSDGGFQFHVCRAITF